MSSHTQSVLEFNFSDADIILVGGDDQKRRFAVHKCILSAASPVFKDMFMLPQPKVIGDALPVINMTESSKILSVFLQFIYPVPNPTISSLEELVLVLEAAKKLDVDVAIDSLRKQLIHSNNVDNEPLRVYAIAARFDLQEELKVAAKYTLKKNVLDCPLSKDLKYITAYDYHRLLDLHRRHSRAMQAALLPKRYACSGHNCNPARWWTAFVEAANKELSERPSTDIIFQPEFLLRCLPPQNYCSLCAYSALRSYPDFLILKKKIDELPFTV
ncbi:uncharacterized protein BT62DRAFT_789336 [Guyanagaster necrorhizus]|uniref:BTB domain-containing protein n=1 Tax=Guyanagaster necrorhizus TaxID=856835 RepID=A0A9P7VUP6_9AGAR|nr:uncharacterized protein BT62DRAFT_789336 [Guyanagaster necrorhizus MCA 3950]KAG7447703.1 hypothetical protein BT62DRAFT_789336 [Guyanagaster necrorhizus MCA 3950]